MSETPKYDIMEDDRYSEVFLDVEKGDTHKNEDIAYSDCCEVAESKDSNVSIEHVYHETKDKDHFVNKLAMELEHIKNQQGVNRVSVKRNQQPESERYFSNSPLTMSLCSSHVNSDYEDSVEGSIGSKRQQFKKLTYQEVEDSLNRYYTREVQISSEIDILLTYLKGQKHIFKQASRVTEQKFNFLMFPAIFIAGTMTVITPFLNEVGWSGYVMSVLNALLTVMITINNFMKFQAVAAIYLTISNQYDKLGISTEMTRNQHLFVKDDNEKSILILEKMRDTEKRIMDIQNNYNDIIVPYEVQLMNPVISHINIFSFIKKIEHHKKTLIMKYKDVKNEIRYMMFKWDKEQYNHTAENVIMNEKRAEEIEKMQKLLQRKEDIKQQLIQNNSSHVYSYIDNLFIREIQHSEHYYTYHSAGMYIIFRPKPLEIFKYGNPVVDDYLNFIFTDGGANQTPPSSPL
jgi:hypothetical protein